MCGGHVGVNIGIHALLIKKQQVIDQEVVFTAKGCQIWHLTTHASTFTGPSRCPEHVSSLCVL